MADHSSQRILALLMCLSALGANASAAEVLTATDPVHFETSGQNIWSSKGPDASDTDSEYIVPFDVELLRADTGDLVIGDSVHVAPAFGTATLQGEPGLGLFCGDGEFKWRGDCYACGGLVDPVASVIASDQNDAAICVNTTDLRPAKELGPPNCPADLPVYDALTAECHAACPSGQIWNPLGRSCEAPIVGVAASCAADETRVGDLCVSCADGDRDVVKDIFAEDGAFCRKPADTTIMEEVGSTVVGTRRSCSRQCVDTLFGQACGPEICVNIPTSTTTGRVTAFIETSGTTTRYFDCPADYAQDPLVPFNQNGICRRSFENVPVVARTADCPGNIQPVLGQCTGTVSYPQPTEPTAGLLCPTGSFADPEVKLGACFYCAADEVHRIELGPDQCQGTSPGTLEETEASLGCAVGQFLYVDPLNGGNGGCYSCDVDGMVPTLVAPATSAQACAGLDLTDPGAPGSFELGFENEAGVGFRAGLRGDLSIDGGVADVAYDTTVTVDVVPLGDADSARFLLQADLADAGPELRTTTPNTEFILDAFSESYARSVFVTHYIDVGEDGLPTQGRLETTLLDTNSTTGDPEQEIGPLGYGVDTERLLLFHIGTDGIRTEVIDFPDFPLSIPSPDLEAQFSLRGNRPTNPAAEELAFIAGEIDALLPANLYEGWDPIHTQLIPLPGFGPVCKWRNNRETLTSEELDFLANTYPLEDVGDGLIDILVPPCREQELFEVYTALPDLTTPLQTNLDKPFDGEWANSGPAEDALLGQTAQFVGSRVRSRDPFAPYDPFFSAASQTTDLLKLGLDLDALGSLGTGTAMGVVGTTRLLGKPVHRYKLDALDIDLAATFSFQKRVAFQPRMIMTLHFSEPVEIDGELVDRHDVPLRTKEYLDRLEALDGSERVVPLRDRYAISVDGALEAVDSATSSGPADMTPIEPDDVGARFNEVEFRHTGGDLQITRTYSLRENRFRNDTLLTVQPIIEGELLALQVHFKARLLKSLLPNFKFSALNYSLQPAPLRLVDLLPVTYDENLSENDNQFEDGDDDPRTFPLGGFTDEAGGDALRVLVPGLDVDDDGDGLIAGRDNCPDVANADQADLDGDGLGDACDADKDGDGFDAAVDPDDENAMVRPDSDGDGVDDSLDNCLVIENAEQLDDDGDGIGDACDADFVDADGDGFADTTDNCPALPNADQLDADGDGFGDRCDPGAGPVRVITFDRFGDGTEIDQIALRDALLPQGIRITNPGRNVQGQLAVVAETAPNAGRPHRVERSSQRAVSKPNVLRQRDRTSSVTQIELVRLDVETNAYVPDVSARIQFFDVYGGSDRSPQTIEVFGAEAALIPDAVITATELAQGMLYVVEAPGIHALLLGGNGNSSSFDDIAFHPDVDADGIANTADNCAAVANTDQADLDDDGVGDPCDPDTDGDGFPNVEDNCPVYAENVQSGDRDGDGLGDACDPDGDGDGVSDDVDLCPLIADPLQFDLDGDLAGDACDGDIDGDGVANDDDADPANALVTGDADQDTIDDRVDNCPVDANLEQSDLDADGVGDACDDDLDGDGVGNFADAFPFDATEAFDGDQDGVGSNADNCPLIANPRPASPGGEAPADCEVEAENCSVDLVLAPQADADGDGVGDACDAGPAPALRIDFDRDENGAALAPGLVRRSYTDEGLLLSADTNGSGALEPDVDAPAYIHARDEASSAPNALSSTDRADALLLQIVTPGTDTPDLSNHVAFVLSGPEPLAVTAYDQTGAPATAEITVAIEGEERRYAIAGPVSLLRIDFGEGLAWLDDFVFHPDADGDGTANGADQCPGFDDAGYTPLAISATPATLEAQGPEGAVHALAFQESGGCGPVTVVLDPMQDRYALGTTAVTVTASDALGSLTALADVVVQDTTAPTITAPADVVIAPGLDTTPEALGRAAATDLVDPLPTLAFTDAESSSGPDLLDLRVLTRTWTATDTAGNQASAVQRITVRETDLQPTVSIVGAEGGIAPLDVTLRVEALGGNLPLAFAWRVGTEAFTTAEVTIALEEAGTVAVELTVTDRDGDVVTETAEIVVTEITIADLQAQIATARATRTALRDAHLEADTLARARIDALKAEIAARRAALKRSVDATRAEIAGLQQLRRSSEDAAERLALADRIAELRDAIRAAHLAFRLERNELRDAIGAERRARRAERLAFQAQRADLTRQIIELRREIRVRRPNGSAERDAIDADIAMLQLDQQQLAEEHGTLRLELGDVVEELRGDRRDRTEQLALATDLLRDEISMLRFDLRRASDRDSKNAIRGEIEIRKQTIRILREASKQDVAAIDAQIATMRAERDGARDDHRTARDVLREQVRALKQLRRAR